MKKYNAYTMTIDEYNDLMRKVTNDTMWIENECGDWFYVVTDDCEIEDDEVNDLLGQEVNDTVVDIIVDLYTDKVAIICE